MGLSGLNRVLAVATNTFRETVRQRVLYNLVIFAILMMLSGFLVGQLSIRQDEKIIKDLGLAAIDLFGTLIAVMIGMSLVSNEIERRSLHPLLAKPLSRGEFLVGKFAGLALTLTVNVAAMTAGLYLTLALTGRSLDFYLLKAIVPTLVALFLVTAMALLFSTLTSTPVAAIATVALVVAGRFADVVKRMHDVVPDVPGWLTTALYYAMPNLLIFDFKDRAVYRDPIAGSELAAVLVYGAVYTALLLSLAIASFRRRDLT